MYKRQLFNSAQRLLDSDGWTLVPGAAHEGLPALLGAALDRTAADLAERVSPDSSAWRWGHVHTMLSPHPLASERPELSRLHPPADGVPGDNDTVRCASIIPHAGDRAAGSSVARYVFDVADWDQSGWVVPHGVSGVRGSGHDLDQRQSWLAGELIPMAYSAAAVAEVAASSFEL